MRRAPAILAEVVRDEVYTYLNTLDFRPPFHIITSHPEPYLGIQVMTMLPDQEASSLYLQANETFNPNPYEWESDKLESVADARNFGKRLAAAIRRATATCGKARVFGNKGKVPVCERCDYQLFCLVN